MLKNLTQYGEFAQRLTIGGIYHYVYDAKYKEQLDTWDRLPLCVPIDITKKHILGLNLHYVPVRTRRLILIELIGNIQKINDNVKLQRANYAVLQRAAIFDDVSPCIKKYLFNHVRSPFLEIYPRFWPKIVELPTAQWTGKRPY